MISGTARAPAGLPRRVLMTVDAVGGVWRYAMDLAAGLSAEGLDIVFAGQGPRPTAAQRREAEAIGKLRWLADPLDWMASGPGALAGAPGALAHLAREADVDLVHLNLPSQACGLELDRPVVVAAHSCVVTWFGAVRGGPCPAEWQWQKRLNRGGFDRADRVVAPSRAHAAAIEACYGPVDGMTVVPNGSDEAGSPAARRPFVFAAGRWWDEGKNGAVLDRAARLCPWPVQLAGPLAGPNGQRLDLSHAQGLGSLEHGAVRRLMAEAAIFASPSLYEPFGLAALEAARAGTPLVLADIATYRELWDGAALFADPRDPNAFAAAFARLAADAALRREFGRRACERAHRLTLETQRRAMLDLYASALAVRRQPVRLAVAQ